MWAPINLKGGVSTVHIKCFWGLITALIFLYPNLVIGQEEPVGKIISITGTGSAEYLPGTGPEPVAEAKPGEVQPVAFQPWKKVVPRQPVYVTDEFRTAPRSRIRILFNDKSLLALGPGSQLKISSYLYKPKDKLRQGQLNLVRGVAMYIINKSQIHKRSYLRIITPTAVVSSRGTQGYLKVSSTQTIVANDAGCVSVGSSDPAVGGETQVCGNMRTTIAVGQQPSQPVAVPQAQLDDVRNFVVGWVFNRSSGLIEREPGEEEAGEPAGDAGEGDGEEGDGGEEDGGGLLAEEFDPEPPGGDPELPEGGGDGCIAP